MLYAQDRWGVLLIFQAMDAAGKDGAIKHVMSGINPQGCQVYSFKAPSSEDLDHDFLWRCMRCLPSAAASASSTGATTRRRWSSGSTRSSWRSSTFPAELVTKDIWEDRFQDIRAFERYLTRNGIIVRKFFLNVSKKEQRKRFLSRIEEPEKNWKFSAGDIEERGHWDDYMDAYEDMIRNTATKRAPWYVVPADNKWFTRVVVAAAVIEALSSLDLAYPTVSAAKLKSLAAAKRSLLRE